MTMSSSVSKVTLNGDGSQTSWPFSFKVWKADDLEVILTSPEGTESVTTDWSVVLAGIGGTLTYPILGDPLPTGWKITIRRSMGFLQEVDLVSGTRWDPEVVETALDIATAERQQLLEEISRTVRVGVASGEDPADVINQVFEARDAAQDSAGDAAAQVLLAEGHADNAALSAADAANNVTALLAGYVVDAQTAKAGAELAEDGAQVAQLAAEAISIEAAARAYNYIINGNFDIWQRGTSQTTSGYGSADRWLCGNVGTTKTTSLQTFALGQTEVPDNPRYYMRHVVTSVAGAANYCALEQRIESVKTLAGQTATLSFWAKTDTPKNIAIDFAQYFGTGGTPSTVITGIGSQLVALTTSWTKYTVTVNIPSIAGKILGTDSNDCLICRFWFDAGFNHATGSANLGQQSGTFDIACVSLIEGDVDVKPIPRSVGEEMALCMRYYEKGTIHYCTGGGAYTIYTCVQMGIPKRAVPTIAHSGVGERFTTWSLAALTNQSLKLTILASAAAAYINADWQADAEL